MPDIPGLLDIATNGSQTNRQLGQLIQVLSNIFPRVFGTFTLAAAATTVVAQPAVKANSLIVLSPTTASAGTLQGSAKALYISTIVPGVSFTVATASGGNAVGTEGFSYTLVNPV